MAEAPEASGGAVPSGNGDARHRSHAQLLQLEKDYFEVPLDSWGAGFVVIVKDLADMLVFKARLWQVCRCMFCLFCLFLNLIMQAAVLTWVSHFVIGNSVRTIQEHYQSYHAYVFNQQGEFVNARWQAFPFRAYMCQAAISKELFLSAVLFFWTARMIVELRGCDRLYRHVWNLPVMPHDAASNEMVHETTNADEEDLHEVVGLTCFTRFILFAVILIPKLMICLALLWLGCRWLTSTESFDDLILNALALEFILNVDELIFECFCPARMTKYIDQVKIAIPKIPTTKQEESRALVMDYVRSMGYLAFCFAWVYSYLTYLQSVLPDFKQDIGHCEEFINKYFTPECQLFQSECFPFGRIDEA